MLGNVTFAELITFTRASPAWRFNASGLLVQEGNNVPRFDYDPVTLQARGMLVEEAATNLCTYSADFSNAAWAKTGISVAAGGAVGPDGASSMWKLVETAVAGSHGLIRNSNVTVGENSPVTIWFVLKAGERRYGRVRLATNIGFLSEVRFDLVAGKVINSAGAVIGDLEPYGGAGCWRVALTATTQVGSTNLTGSGVYFWDTPTGGSGGVDAYTGDGASGVFCFAAQVEQRAFPSSYVATTTAIATRAAETASVPTLSKFGFNPAEGTFIVEAEGIQANAKYAFCVSDGTTNNMMGVSRQGTSVLQSRVTTGGVVVGIGLSSSYNGERVKVGLTYGQGAHDACLNGGPVLSAASGTPSVLNTLRVGSLTNVGQVGGWVRSLRYYPRRLSNAELQALTA